MKDFRKSFPALTPTQRLHLEVYGYVVIERAISDDRVKTLLENILEIERVYRETGKYLYGIVANAHSKIDPDYFRIDNLPHTLPCFFDYLTDPYLVGMAQEIVGTHVRLLQSDAHVIRYPQEKMKRQGYEFHAGWHPESGSTTNGLYSTLAICRDFPTREGRS